MDNLTHAMLGLSINNLLADTKRNRGTFWISLVASELPDIDILYRFKGAAEYMLNHRGISHSVVALVLFAGMITLAAKKIFPENRSRLVFLLALGCLGTHVLFDLFTSWGTQFLAPFSDKYFYLDYLPIVDLVIMGILVFFLLLSRLCVSCRSKMAVLGLLLVCCFVFARGVTHHRLVSSIQNAYPGAHVAVLPGFSPLHWEAMVDSGDALMKKDIILTGTENQGNMDMLRKSQGPLALYQDHEEFKQVINFFRKPVLEIEGDMLVVRDLYYSVREVVFPLNDRGEITGKATSERTMFSPRSE